MIVDGKTVSTKVIKEREIDNMPASSQENDNLENPPNKEIKNLQEESKKEEKDEL